MIENNNKMSRGVPAKEDGELQSNQYQVFGESQGEIPQEVSSVLRYITLQDSHEMKDGELTRILSLMNEQSAFLILLLLCDDKLDLRQVEVESDNGMLESKLKAVRSITGFPSRVDIARASRHFMGRSYSEGHVVSFSHPNFYATCAHALYTLNPRFLLQNCSLKFLCEKIQHQSTQSTTLNDDHNFIYVSEMYYDIFASRLAEVIEEGYYSISLSHPILQEETVVEKVFHQLKSRSKSTVGNNTSSSVILCKTDEGKYLLQWAVKAQSVYLVKILEASAYCFFEREIIKGFHTCIRYGSKQIINHLIAKYGSVISTLHRKQGFGAAIDYCRIEVADLLMQYGAGISDLSVNRQIKLFHMAGQQGNMMLCEDALCHALDYHPVTNHVRTFFRSKPEVVFRVICNESLQIACTHACMSLTEMVVAFSDINNRGQHGRTPIINAAYMCKNDMLNHLMRKGADLTLTDNDGDTVLHHACRGGNQSCVEHILPSFDINVPGWNGRTPVMTAAIHGQKDICEMLMTKGADLTLTSTFGSTVFHLACLGGNQSIVEVLLPTFDINNRGRNAWTPVMYSIESGNIEMLKLLVNKGADLSLTNEYGDNVLHIACQRGSKPMVQYLLPAFDINCRGLYGRTPVMRAVTTGHEKLFQLLVRKGADLELTDNDGTTVFHLACQGGNMSIVSYTMPLFNINLRGEIGLAPLMQAVSGGHTDVYDLLMSQHADASLKDDCGDTLLHLACEGGHLRMVKYVLPYFDINTRNKPGWTAAMVALIHGHTKVFNYLVDEGTDLSLVDNVGDDILTLARRGGCAEVVQKCCGVNVELQLSEKWTELMQFLVYGVFTMDNLKQGCPQLEQRDRFGDTLLHLASRGGNKQCVEHLLPSYDINVRGRNGWTPVMMAARCGHLDVLQMLLSHQADLSLVSDTGEDVYTLARRAGHVHILNFLVTLPEIKGRDSLLDA